MTTDILEMSESDYRMVGRLTALGAMVVGAYLTPDREKALDRAAQCIARELEHREHLGAALYDAQTAAVLLAMVQFVHGCNTPDELRTEGLV